MNTSSCVGEEDLIEVPQTGETVDQDDLDRGAGAAEEEFDTLVDNRHNNTPEDLPEDNKEDVDNDKEDFIVIAGYQTKDEVSCAVFDPEVDVEEDKCNEDIAVDYSTDDDDSVLEEGSGRKKHPDLTDNLKEEIPINITDADIPNSDDDNNTDVISVSITPSLPEFPLKEPAILMGKTCDMLAAESTSPRLVLFFLTPSRQVVSVKNIIDGTKVIDIKAKLETLSGIPAYMYQFCSPKYKYSDNTELLVGRNVATGSVIRMSLLNQWKQIYEAVDSRDLDRIGKNQGLSLFGAADSGETEESVNKGFMLRLFTALFIATYKDSRKVCDALIKLGADVTDRTLFGNTVLHVAASQNHMPLIDYLLKQGADLSVHNNDGKSAIHIAKDIGSTTCERYMRLYSWTLTGKKCFPDIETVSESRDSDVTDFRAGVKDAHGKYARGSANRSKSAPIKRTYVMQKHPARSSSKFHADCGKKLDFVSVNVSDDESNDDTNRESQLVQLRTHKPVEKSAPFIDMDKTNDNQTVIDFRKPRAKSAVVHRVKHTPVYYHWYNQRPIPTSSRYIRCQSASSKTGNVVDEEKRELNELAFQAWVTGKEKQGAFYEREAFYEEELLKEREYSDKENERAFQEWLIAKKVLLVQISRGESSMRKDRDEEREKVDPNEYHTAYQRWMRQREENDVYDRSKYMAVEDMKQLIELKRKRTVLSVKMYEEWLEQKRKANVLLNRRRARRKQSPRRPDTFQKWIGMTATGDDTVEDVKSNTQHGYRPVHSAASRVPSRLSIKSLDSTNITPITTTGKTVGQSRIEQIGRKPASGYDADRNRVEGFVWRNISYSHPTAEEKYRVVHFKTTTTVK